MFSSFWFLCIACALNTQLVLGNYKNFKPNMEYKAAVAHHDYVLKNQSQAVNNIGAYILGTMFGATEYGETPSTGHPHNGANFWQRAIMAAYSYARHAPHFYVVTGAGQAEQRILGKHPKCIDLTAEYKEKLVGAPDSFKFEMYNCDGIKVLHFPECNGDSWGSKGPCCRCEKAMRFHLYAHDSNSWPRFPNWFTFSDDDYYTRLSMMEQVLSGYDTTRPYALMSEASVRGNVRVGESHKMVQRPGYGGTMYSKNCSVPCVHRWPWMGWAGFSIGALREMKSAMENNELQDACTVWSITHDVGLGLFTWEYGHSLIPIRIQHDMNNYNMLWHQCGKDFDVILQEIWHYAWLDHTKNAISFKNNNNFKLDPNEAPFDMDIYLQFERSQGNQYALQNHLIPVTGFQSTLFDRRRRFRATIHDAAGEDLKNDHLTWKRSSYSPTDCNEDMQYYTEWKQALKKSDPIKFTDQIFTQQEVKMCLHYDEHVQNMHVSIPLSDLPADEDISRRLKHELIHLNKKQKTQQSQKFVDSIST